MILRLVKYNGRLDTDKKTSYIEVSDMNIDATSVDSIGVRYVTASTSQVVIIRVSGSCKDKDVDWHSVDIITDGGALLESYGKNPFNKQGES